MGLFLLAFGLLTAGAVLLMAVLISVRSERRIEQRRLGLLSASSSGIFQMTRPLAHARGLSSILDEPIQRLFSLGLRRRWGVRAKGPVLLAVGLAGGAAAWITLRNVIGLHPLVCLPLAIAAFYAPPWMVLRIGQERTEAKFIDLFPDAIDIVVRMLRAGLPVTAAVRVVGEEAPSPVKEAFAALADDILIGKPAAEAFVEMGERISLADVRFFAVAVSLQQGTGGNLASTLEIMSEIIRKRRAMRLKARAVTAEVRLSALVLAAIPVVAIGGFWLFDREYLQILITDHRGNLILLVAAAMLIVGFAIMRQMTRSVSRI